MAGDTKVAGRVIAAWRAYTAVGTFRRGPRGPGAEVPAEYRTEDRHRWRALLTCSSLEQCLYLIVFQHEVEQLFPQSRNFPQCLAELYF